MDSQCILQSIQQLDNTRFEKYNPNVEEMCFLRIFDGSCAFSLPDNFRDAAVRANIQKFSDNDEIMDVTFTNSNAAEFSDLMKQFLIYVMDKCKIKKPNEALEILDRLVNDDSLNNNPDLMPEFKYVKKSIPNTILSWANDLIHPGKMLFNIVNVPAQFIVRPFLEDNPTHLHNLNTMLKFGTRGTLGGDQAIYKAFLKECLTEYAAFTKLVKQGCGIQFRFNIRKHSFGITELRRYVPRDNLEHLIDCLRRMYDITQTQDPSYDIYKNVSRIYQSEFIPECEKFHWKDVAREMIERLGRGERTESLLSEIASIDIHARESKFEKNAASIAKIIALCIIRLVIGGVGSNAHEMHSFFGTVTGEANCSTYNGDIRLYDKKNANAINRKIILYLTREMNEAGYKISDDLSTKKFIKKAKKNYEQMKKKLLDKKKKVKNSFGNNAKRYLTMSSCPTAELVSTGIDCMKTISKAIKYGQEEEYLDAMKAIILFLEETSPYIDDPSVFGFEVRIISQYDCSIQVDTIKIKIP